MHDRHSRDWASLATQIKAWGKALGFDAIGISAAQLPEAAATKFAAWLAAGYHGEMDYMARHGTKRIHAAELVPGTQSVICARLNYWPQTADGAESLSQAQRAYVSRYALGRDYHKLMRNRLQKLAEKIMAEIPDAQTRVVTDSAPVLEVAHAEQGGLGWRGKHTLLLSRDAGSYFFLGEILTDLPLPADAPVTPHCGSCQACLDICPTQAFVAPYQLDARRCISYLTIELKGSIPPELRPLLSNRVYGCDDCQLVCPWNRFAPRTREEDFVVRNGLDVASLIELAGWTAEEFDTRLAGSAIRRIGHEQWLRNLAVGLGNLPPSRDNADAIAALARLRQHASDLVREHAAWALARLVPR